MAVVGEGEGFHHCLFVCVFVIHHNMLNIDAARITKLDVQMLRDEYWKPVYFGVKRSRLRVKKQCWYGSLHSCDCWLLLVMSMCAWSAWCTASLAAVAVTVDVVAFIPQKRRGSHLDSSSWMELCHADVCHCGCQVWEQYQYYESEHVSFWQCVRLHGLSLLQQFIAM